MQRTARPGRATHVEIDSAQCCAGEAAPSTRPSDPPATPETTLRSGAAGLGTRGAAAAANPPARRGEARRGEARRGVASGGYCRIRSSFSCSCAILACAAASAASSVRAAATPTQRRGTAGGGGPVPAGPRAAWVGPLRGAGGRLGRYSQDRLRLLPCPSSVPRATRGRPGAAHVALSVGASPAQAGRQAGAREAAASASRAQHNTCVPRLACVPSGPSTRRVSMTKEPARNVSSTERQVKARR
jgi:hypothetical protein